MVKQSQCTFPRFLTGLVLTLLLPTPTIWFSVDHKRNVSDGVVSGIGTLFSLDHKLYASDYDSDSDSVASENQPSSVLVVLVVIYLFIYLLIYQLYGHRPAHREFARTGLRSHAKCHPYPIPQPVKVGHTTGVYHPYSFQIVTWLLLRPTRTNQ